MSDQDNIDAQIRAELLTLFRLVEGNLITAASEVYRLNGYKYDDCWKSLEEAIEKVRLAHDCMVYR